MTNTVIIQGRLTADPEIKTTQSGKSVCSYTVAVDRNTTEKQTDFIRCVAWEKNAEFLKKYFHKGDMLIVEGSLQTRSYEDRNGNKQTATEVLSNRHQFCGSKSSNKSADVEPDITVDDDDDFLPF